MASHPPVRTAAQSKISESLKAAFLDRFEDEQRVLAGDLLDLARASYRLRDDDNISSPELKLKLWLPSVRGGGRSRKEVLMGLLRSLRHETSESPHSAASLSSSQPQDTRGLHDRLKPRQLRGQPAGPGIARGPARTIRSVADLLEFKHGEVLVCDAVDPNMTFVVPLAAAIVERRGGMLIHGAIIAREYGLPCVTGVANVAELVRTGDLVTVDGFLGLVTIGSAQFS